VARDIIITPGDPRRAPCAALFCLVVQRGENPDCWFNVLGLEPRFLHTRFPEGYGVHRTRTV